MMMMMFDYDDDYVQDQDLHVDVATCDIPEMMVHGCMDWGFRIRRVLSSLPSGKQTNKLLKIAIYTGFTR